MNSKKHRKLAALWAIGQGLLTALAPQLSTKLTKRMIGKNFDNADKLIAKPSYLRQLRAIGVGFAAAGLTHLALESVVNEEAQQATTEETTESES